jgi:hypothetical protein
MPRKSLINWEKLNIFSLLTGKTLSHFDSKCAIWSIIGHLRTSHLSSMSYNHLDSRKLRSKFQQFEPGKLTNHPVIDLEIGKLRPWRDPTQAPAPSGINPSQFLCVKTWLVNLRMPSTKAFLSFRRENQVADAVIRFSVPATT